MLRIPFVRALLLVACTLSPVAVSAQSRADVSSRHPDAVGSRPPPASAPVVPHGTFPSFANEGWASRTAMPAGRWAQAMASYSTGVFPANESYVYVIGGADAAFANTALLSRYDVDGDAWANLSPMPTARSQISAVRVGERIYVPGGYSGSFSPVNTMSIYDIPTDTWSTGAPLPQATGDYAIGTYADRYVYVIGGYSGTVDLNLVQVYDTVANNWQAATPKIGAATAGLRGGIVGDRIVVAGGYSQTLAATQSTTTVGTIDPNNPLIIAWSVGAAYPGGAAGRLGAGVPVAAGPAIGSDLVNAVLFTGGDPDGAGTAVMSSTWLYDFNDDAWKAGPIKPTGVSNIGNLAGVASGGKMHMVSTGGYNGAAVVAVNEWLTFGDEPVTDLAISVTAEPAMVVPGASIVYTVAYSASGDDSTVANVSTTVPAGTVLDSANSALAWICVPDTSAGSTCSANVGTLSPGDSGSLDFAVESLYPVPAGVTEILFEADIAGTSADADPSDNSATSTVSFAAGSVAITPTSGLVTDESGATATFDVVLDVPPVVDVTIDFVSSDTSEGTPSPNQIVFTPADWNVAQTVSVTGIGDLAQDGDIAYTVDGTIAAGAANYDGVTVPAVSLTNEDTPTGSVSVAPTSGLVTDESGGSDTFEVVLEVAPLGNVVIDFVSSDPGEGTPSPNQLLFTAADWNQPQTVTVTGQPDTDDDGDVAYSIAATIAAGALNYTGVVVPSVAVINEDSPPPSVIAVSSVRDTGDGVLDADETTSRSITQLIVEFNGTLGAAALDTSSYRLVDAGPDGGLDSTSCTDVPSGDDVEIAIDTVIYTTVPSTAVLAVGGGFALPRGSYRLFVCDALRSLAGVSLDGDDDGLAGGDFTRDFATDTNNSIENPNFDEDFAGWIAISGSGIGWSANDGDAAPTSGSTRIDTSDGAGLRHWLLQCVDGPLLGGASAVARIASGTPGFPDVAVGVEYFAGPGCSDEVVAVARVVVAGDSGGAWVPIVARTDAWPDAASSRIVLEVSAGDAADYTVEFDHAASVSGIPLFADGFETIDAE